jgi:hypothetical protein
MLTVQDMSKVQGSLALAWAAAASTPDKSQAAGNYQRTLAGFDFRCTKPDFALRFC